MRAPEMSNLQVDLASDFTITLDNDAQMPSYIFSVPGLDGSFGILGSPLSFWIHLGTLLLTQTVIRIALAIVFYELIIQKRGTTTAFLVGYGFVIPFVLALPFYVIPLLDVRNLVLMMGVSTTPTFVFFNCLEAMYGTSPPFVERTLVSYCIYYSSPVPFVLDHNTGKLVKASWSETLAKALAYLKVVAMTSLFFSFLIPAEYAPFPSPRPTGQPLTAFIHLFHWGHLMNNYIVACLTSLALDGGMLGVALGVNLLTGYSTIATMNNPLSKSTSPSDFWGRRWNHVVHGILKRGVYLPLRQHFSRSVAAAGTFIASGLLHEYILCVISLKARLYSERGSYVPRYGMHIAFFAWNACIIVIEHALKGNKLLKRMRHLLPAPTITGLVLMTVIPVSHWFTDEYVASGFFTDYSVGFPRIVALS